MHNRFETQRLNQGLIRRLSPGPNITAASASNLLLANDLKNDECSD
jgi:hypothetical protein